MAVTNELTWSITPNGLVTGDVTRTYGSADLTDGWKTLWLALIADFKANNWIVRGSSDGVTGAMDGSDRWGVIADLRGADVSGGPAVHSWTVISLNGMYVLLSHGHRASGTLPAQHITMSVAATNYTGGDASNDPTSVDEAQLKAGTGFATNKWIEDTSGTANLRWHTWHSSTGKNSRVAVYIGGELRSVWLFEELKNSPTGWTTPWLLGIGAGSPAANGYDQYWNTTERMWNTYHAGASVRARFSTMCLDYNGAGESAFVLTDAVGQAHSVSNEFAFFPYNIWVNEAGHWGRMGTIYDLWNEANAADAAGYPATPGDQTKVGAHWVFPGDGVTTFLTS